MNKIAEIRSSLELLSNGLKVFGVLHLPETKTESKIPAVLFCHGFGGNKIGKFRLAVKLAERLSQIGIASLRIDFRGSGDSEGDFADTTIQTQLDDAKIALQYLQEHPSIDTSNIAVAGRSLGGAIATHLAAEHGQIRALALWCPLFDAQPWVIKQKNGTSEFQFLGQKLSPECIRQFAALNTVQPMTLLQKTPMLIVRAGRDEILTSYHHEQYLTARNGCQSTQDIELSRSNHDFADTQDQEILLETTTSFLQRIFHEE